MQALGNVSAACGGEQNVEEGYNSEDEYSHVGVQLTEEEWQEKDRRFERLIKKKKGLSIRKYYQKLLAKHRFSSFIIKGNESSYSFNNLSLHRI